jgi:hypothetical protein
MNLGLRYDPPRTVVTGYAIQRCRPMGLLGTYLDISPIWQKVEASASQTCNCHFGGHGRSNQNQ